MGDVGERKAQSVLCSLHPRASSRFPFSPALSHSNSLCSYPPQSNNVPPTFTTQHHFPCTTPHSNNFSLCTVLLFPFLFLPLFSINQPSVIRAAKLSILPPYSPSLCIYPGVPALRLATGAVKRTRIATSTARQLRIATAVALRNKTFQHFFPLSTSSVLLSRNWTLLLHVL